MKITRRALIAASLGALTTGWTARAQPVEKYADDTVVEDIFGNIINEKGIALVDWDGYIANPVVDFFLRPPTTITFPATVTLMANDPSLYFDRPSTAGPLGPRKTVKFTDSSSRVPVGMSVFPDRRTDDRDYRLTIWVTDASGMHNRTRVDIHLFDQDTNTPSPFAVHIDFSDDSLAMMTDPARQAVVKQAADDWAYFIDDMKLDPVPIGNETTWILSPTGDSDAYTTTNPMVYTGLLVYVYGGLNGSSSYGSSVGEMQTSHKHALPLRRSGGVQLSRDGNHNTLGWLVDPSDNDWWRSDNRVGSVNDLYSIAHHELGHAIAFHTAYPRDAEAQRLGQIVSSGLLAYMGTYPQLDANNHLSDSVDKASRRGAFGNEYDTDMPDGRWVITKLDVLCLQAFGYTIRPTFDLAILTSELPPAQVSMPYFAPIGVRGGIPWYDWWADGRLPDGLSIDSYTGSITGIPDAAGTFDFLVNVRDWSKDRTSVFARFTIQVSA